MDQDASISLAMPPPPRTVPVTFLSEPAFVLSDVPYGLPFAVAALAHACLLRRETGCRVLARARCTDARSSQEQV